MRMLCDKHSTDYLKIKPYQKDIARQQAHKTETSVSCAHYPPPFRNLLKTRSIINQHTSCLQIMNTHILLGMSSFFGRKNLNADVYGSDSLLFRRMNSDRGWYFYCVCCGGLPIRGKPDNEYNYVLEIYFALSS